MFGKQKLQNNIGYKFTARKIFAIFGLVALVFAGQIPNAEAAIPKYINFQGKLTAISNGNNVANGSYTFEFKLYTAVSGGSLLWTETWDGSPAECPQLAVAQGVFNAKLGSCNPLTGVDFTTGSLFLSVNFDDGGGFDGEMSPRKQLVSSAYAFVANGVSGDGVVNTANQSTTALTVGRGATYPALQVDTNTASSETGVKVTAAAAAGGVAIAAISSGANEALTINSKGTGEISLGSSSTGNINIGSSGTGDILLGGGSGSTGCTVTNSSGALACSAGLTGVGVNASTGLLQGQLGLTVSGAAVSLNHDSNFAVNIATGTTNTLTTIGGGSGTFSLQTTNIDISNGGAITGATGITSATGNITATAGNLVATAGDLVFGATTRITNAGVGTFITGTVIGSQTFTTNNIADSGALTIASGGAGALTLDSASNAIVIAATDTTLQRTASGTYNINLIDGSNTTLSVTNSGAGVANLTVDGTITASDDLNVGTSSTPGLVTITGSGSDNQAFITSTTFTGLNAYTLTTENNSSISGGNLILKAGDGHVTYGVNGNDVLIYGGALAGAGANGDVILAHTGSVAQGNVGIGDASPAAMLTVGSGDLFQVNSSGAIAAATAITSAGNIRFTGLSGGGTQCVNVDNDGDLGVTTCGGTTLQAAYSGGNSIETAANTAVVITETTAAANTGDLLQLTYNAATGGTNAGDALQITMDGVDADSNTGSGLKIIVDQSQNTGSPILVQDDAAVTLFQLNENGGITLGAATAETTAITVTDTDYTNALSIGDNDITGTTFDIIGTTAVINFSNFDVDSAGSVTAVGVNAGAGLLQGQLGLTVSGAAVSLNNDSNFAVNIATGTSTGTINLGGTGAQSIQIGSGVGVKTITIGNAADDTFSLASSGLNVSTGGALTGVASIDTINVSSTALTFTSTAPTISVSTAATNISLEAGTTGQINIGSVSSGNVNIAAQGTGNILLGGGSASTGCTVTNSTGALGCTSTISSGIAGGTIGGFLVSGNTSGTVSILPQAAAGTYNFNLPTTAGNSGEILTSAGGGASPMTWTAPGALAVRLSSLAAANTTNTIDNLNNAQVWNWGSLTTQAGLSLKASGFTQTTGTILQVGESGGATGITLSTGGQYGSTQEIYAASYGDNTTGTTTTAALGVNTTNNSGSSGGIQDTLGIDIKPVAGGFTFGSTNNQYGIRIQNQGIAGVDNAYGLYISSQSGATNNYALITGGGNVGISTATPTSLFSVGSTSQFQVNSSGAIAAAVGITSAGGAVSLNNNSNFNIDLATGTSTGTITLGGTGAQSIQIGSGVGVKTITIGNAADDTFSLASSGLNVSTAGAITGASGIVSSGTIQFSSLTSNGPLYTSSGNGTLTTTAPTSGAIGYWSRTGTVLSQTTANDTVSLSGNSGDILTVASSATGSVNKALNVSQTGAGADYDYAGYFNNTGAATLANIGIYANASGGTDNYAGVFNGGQVLMGGTTNVGFTEKLLVFGSGRIYNGNLNVTSLNTTQTTTSSALSLVGDGLTTGTGLYAASSSLTSGKLVDLQVSGTAAAASQTALNILTTGANGTAGITTYGAQISNTHSTNTSTNVALQLAATGGATANYALLVPASSGSVGIGTTTPIAVFDVQGASYALGGTGDASGNGSTTGFDASTILTYLNGGSITQANYANADINGDGLVSFLDAELIGQYAASAITIPQAQHSVGKYIAGRAISIAYNENVGIGFLTSAPDRKLDVYDASNPQLRLTQADNSVYGDFQVDSNGDLLINIDGVTNQLVLDNGGNVGIGLAAPIVKLQVAGTTLIQPDSTWSSGDTSILLFSDDNSNFVQAYFTPAANSGSLNIRGYSGVDLTTNLGVVLHSTQQAMTNIGSNNDADALLEINGNRTVAAWGLNGIQLQTSASTFTDNDTAGTRTNGVANSFGTPTFAGTNAVTITNAANLYVASAPTAGTNMAFTNSFALWVDNGHSRFDGEALFSLSADQGAGRLQVGYSAASGEAGILVYDTNLGGGNYSQLNAGSLALQGTTSANITINAQTGTVGFSNTNTGNLEFEGASAINFFQIGQYGGIVANEDSNDSDFRIEGNGDINLFFADASTDRIGIGTAAPGGKLDIEGNLSASAWGLDGIQLQASAATFTDSSSTTGTVNTVVVNSFAQPTITGTAGTVTYTDAATVYIANGPTVSGDEAITNSYALWSGGKVNINTGATAENTFMRSSDTTAYSASSFQATSRLNLFSGNGTGAHNLIRFSASSNNEAMFGTVQNASGYAEFIWKSYNGAYAERMRLDSAGALTVPGLATGGADQCLEADTSGKIVLSGSACGSGGGALDTLTASTTDDAALLNGDNTIEWDWALTSATSKAFTIAESAASTGGAGNQHLLKLQTAATSTAGALEIVSNSADGGDIEFNLASAGDFEIQDAGTAFVTFTDGGLVQFASAVTTGTGTSSGISATSSTLTSGTLMDLTVTGAGGLTNQKALNVSTSGAVTGAQTTYGGYFSNTHSGATAVNVGLYATASGATGANYAAIFDQGSVGIGDTTPDYLLDVAGNIGVGTGAADGLIVSNVNAGDYISFESSSNSIDFFSNSTNYLTVNGTAAAMYFNGANANIDFYFRGQSDNAMLYADSSANSIGIGTSGPDRKLDVLDASSPQIRLTQADGTVYGDLQSTTTANLIVTGDSLTGSVKEYGLRVAPTVNQSSAAGASYSALDINVTETGTSSLNGLNRLADFRASDSSKLAIRNDGSLLLQNAANIVTPYGSLGSFQNHLVRSEAFDNASWIKTSVTAPTADTQIAPDGSTTAESLATSGSGGDVCQWSGTAAGSDTFTFSVWARSTSGTQNFDMRVDAGATSCATANNVTGTAVTHTATTSWQRFTVTQTFSSATGNVKARIFPGGTGGTGTIYAWGAQVDKDSKSNSYAFTTSAALTNVNRGETAVSNFATQSGFTYGGRHVVNLEGAISASSSLVGEFIRVIDNSTGTDDTATVRALEVQSYSGTNINGVNTAIAGFGYTFGVHAVTTAQANESAQPAAVFADLDNGSAPTQGNAIRAYSNNVTSSDLVVLYQESTTFSGNGLEMNFGNSGGGSFTGNFISLQTAGTESFHVDDDGSTFVSLTGATATDRLCWDGAGGNNEEIVDCTGTPGDLAENFGTTDASIAAGDVVVSSGEATPTMKDGHFTTKAYIAKSTGSYQTTLLGVVSTQPNEVYADDLFTESENPRPVALVGRVPVKVTTENGPIKSGDYLTSSATQPGKAMKATSSGMVIGQALSSYDGTGDASVIVFVSTGYQSIGNTIVLDAPSAEGQTLQSGNQNLASNTASTFVIQQQTAEGNAGDAPVSNILQLQTGDSNRFMVSSSGATSILSSMTCDLDSAECPSVLKVTQANTELMNIDARGTLTLAGTIFIKDDTFAGSVATGVDGLAEITFSYNLGTGKPVVQLTAEAQIPVFAQILEFKQDEQGNYTGFVIKTFDLISGPISATVHYNVTGKQEGYITLGVAQAPDESMYSNFSSGDGSDGTVAGDSDGGSGGDGVGLIIEGGQVVGGSGDSSSGGFDDTIETSSDSPADGEPIP